MTIENVILDSGKCVCIDEPLGECGLEGYTKSDSYHYQHMSRDRNGKEYMRVYHNLESYPDFYETCGVKDFHRFFKIEVKNV